MVKNIADDPNVPYLSKLKLAQKLYILDPTDPMGPYLLYKSSWLIKYC